MLILRPLNVEQCTDWSGVCCMRWSLCYPFSKCHNNMLLDSSYLHIDGLVQERRNSSALAMELRLSCTNPSIYKHLIMTVHM